ncbi:MAG: protein kinase [Chloroflexota bacterium]
MNLIGKTLGQYQILEPIGAGGMATVYKALQPGLDRHVAIKVLPEQHALTPGFKERFMLEAKAVAQLSHPNILPIYDVGVDDNITYFAMKYVAGKTLSHVMKGPLPFTVAHKYIQQIGAALDHAHERGILHRDVKPVNVLLEDDWVLLADFGLAKIVDGSAALTASWAAMGTPAYISPEQALANPLDHHTDIYSIGIVLYEMLTGQVPYQGETPMGVMFKHAYEPLPLPRQIRPDLPEGVEQVILKAVAKNPQDRYDSATVFADAFQQAIDTAVAAGYVDRAGNEKQIVTVVGSLDNVLSEETKEVAGQPTSSENPQRTFNWLWVGVGGAVAFLFLFLLGVALFMFNPFGGNVPEATPTLITEEVPPLVATATEASIAIIPTETTTPEITLEATGTPTAEAVDSIIENTATATSEPPTTTATPQIIDDTPELLESVRLGRGTVNEIAIHPEGTVVAVTGSLGVWLYEVETLELIRLLEGHDRVFWAVAWSPDGTQLALGSEDGSVHIWDSESGENLQVFQGTAQTTPSIGSASSIDWSPDGDFLAVSHIDSRIRIWDIAQAEEITILQGHLEGADVIRWSPDGTKIASASRDTTVRIWDVKTGGELRRIEGHLDKVTGLSWSPDGQSLVTSGLDFTLRLWDAETGEETNVLTGHTDWVVRVDWSPDGAQIVSGGADQTLRIWDAATGEQQRVTDTASPIFDVAWTPTGDYFVSIEFGGAISVWEAASGEMLVTLEKHSPQLTSLDWAPDGDRFAVGDLNSGVQIWAVDTTAEGQTAETLFTLPGHTEKVTSVAWSPDGKLLASSSEDGTIRLWDSEQGTLQALLEGHTYIVHQVAWSPDGAMLASSDAGGIIWVWDVVTGARLRNLEGHGNEVFSIDWSPDGSRLVSGSKDHIVAIWDASTGEVISTMEGREQAYQQQHEFRGYNWVQSIAWSPDAQWLAAGGHDFVIRLWNPASGAELKMLENHTAPIEQVAWSPDSQLLASASSGKDYGVRVWQVSSGENLYRLVGPTDSVHAIDWSLDGQSVAATGDDGVIRIWEIPAEY